jgi:prepilin-type N-terminal cleavage/methylation domain-containing protein
MRNNEGVGKKDRTADTNESLLPRSGSLTGFTLIELLLVVGIVSLFSTFLISAMNVYRVSARDAVRLNDVRQIQNALEIYYVTNKGYPVCNGGDFCDVDCGAGLNNDGYDGASYQDLSVFLTSQYFQRMPPKLNNVCLWYWGAPGGNRYIVTFKPEAESDILSNPGNQGCYDDGDPWFCVGNTGGQAAGPGT